MVGEAQVVVGAHVDDLGAVFERDHRLLRRCNRALLLEESCLMEFSCLGFELIEECEGLGLHPLFVFVGVVRPSPSGRGVLL